MLTNFSNLNNAPSPLNKSSLQQSQQMFSRKINNVTRIHRCSRCNAGFRGTIQTNRCKFIGILGRTSYGVFVLTAWQSDEAKEFEAHKWNFWKCCKIKRFICYTLYLKRLGLLIEVGCDHYLHNYFSFNSLRVLAVKYAQGNSCPFQGKQQSINFKIIKIISWTLKISQDIF